MNERVSSSPARLRAACAAAVLLALFPLVFWLRVPVRDWFVTPITPIDRTPSIDPAMWTSLWAVRSMIPEGKGVAIVAPTPEQTQTLYMLANGVLSKNELFPRWYFGSDYREVAENAEYVIAFRCTDPALHGTTLIGQAGGACVYRRAGFAR